MAAAGNAPGMNPRVENCTRELSGAKKPCTSGRSSDGADTKVRTLAMNKRQMIDLCDLLDRIDWLLKEYLMASSPERLAFLEAEITAKKEKLQRIAASLMN
jgi:hypothetical protein